MIEQAHPNLRELVRNHTWHIEPFTALHKIKQEEKTIKIVSDGSATENKLTFGWVIVTSSGKPIVTGQGKGYGATTSHRAEAYGMIAATTMLKIWQAYTNAEEIKGQLWYDNQSLLTQLKNWQQYRDCYLNTILEPDWDMVEQIHTNIQDTPIPLTLLHVRGHQDRNPDAQLSIEAQLNVHVDALAGEYSAFLQSALIDTTADMVPMLSVTGALLDLEIGTVTGHYSTMIRMYHSEQEIKQYTQQKAKWSDDTTETVNWRILCQHMQKQAHVNIWSCKYMHNLLPTGNIRHRYNLRKTAGCPRCQHSKETWDHILQCTHKDNRKISTKIRAQIFKHIDELASPEVGQAMKTGISTYMGEQYGEVQELPQ